MFKAMVSKVIRYILHYLNIPKTYSLQERLK